jgi:alanine racemase
MSVTLTVDGARWRAHLQQVDHDWPLMVPVLKGNGYGFTNSRLARRCQWLGVDTVAVGTYHELSGVASRYPGDLVVLTPWRDFHPMPDQVVSKRVIHTISRAQDLAAIRSLDPSARVVLELQSSMRRHGMTTAELTQLSERLEDQQGICGITLHLPLGAGHRSEVEQTVAALRGSKLRTKNIWVSHLTNSELGAMQLKYPELKFRPRVGTHLWLGCRDALSVTATVLDVHPLRRGDAYGYRGRTARRSGHLIIASGGTGHGIGLESPIGDLSLKARAASVAKGSLDAFGVARSPYTWLQKRLTFGEPPHMQASMLFLPKNLRPPVVGDNLHLAVRYTATTFDSVVIT